MNKTTIIYCMSSLQKWWTKSKVPNNRHNSPSISNDFFYMNLFSLQTTLSIVLVYERMDTFRTKQTNCMSFSLFVSEWMWYTWLLGLLSLFFSLSLNCSVLFCTYITLSYFRLLIVRYKTNNILTHSTHRST